MNKSSAIRCALIGGLLAGFIDLAYAFVFYGFMGVTPIAILRSIASGWLGHAAFHDGLASAALGAVTHFGILVVATGLYLATSRKLPWLRQQVWLAGMLYGAAIYLFMHRVVLPLSAAPPFKNSLTSIVSDFCVHVLALGPVIAWTVRRYARN